MRVKHPVVRLLRPAQQTPSSDMCTTNFYIFRHATAISNEKKILAGQIDFPLTETGVTQAISLANSLTDVDFGAAYSSDLQRATTTANIISEKHNLDVVTTNLLRERRWGSELEGKTRDEAEEYLYSYNQMKYEERMDIKMFDDMESDREIIERFESLLKTAHQEHQCKNVIVLSHANIIRTFLAHIGFSSHKDLSGVLRPAEYVIVTYDGKSFNVEDSVIISKQKN
jgi:broad specificity phosphatase PhoE